MAPDASPRSLTPSLHCSLLFAAVDNILVPENRAHLSLEAQLKELLEKLDTVSTMRSSGARTRRVRLLRREINSIRHRLAQQQQSKALPNGDGLDTAPRDGDEEGERGDFDSRSLVLVSSQSLLFLL